MFVGLFGEWYWDTRAVSSSGVTVTALLVGDQVGEAQPLMCSQQKRDAHASHQHVQAHPVTCDEKNMLALPSHAGIVVSFPKEKKRS